MRQPILRGHELYSGSLKERGKPSADDRLPYNATVLGFAWQSKGTAQVQQHEANSTEAVGWWRTKL